MLDIFYLDRKLKTAKPGELSRLLGRRLWIDVTGITKEEASLLRKAFDLHPLTEEDLVSSNTRIKVEDFSGYLFAIFYGIEKNKGVQLVELDFLLGDSFIITNHKREHDCFTGLKKNTAKIEELLLKGPDFVFHKLLDDVVDNFFPVLETIDDNIEKLEESVTKMPRPELLSRILQQKRQIVHIKKTVMPQREKISFLAKNNYRQISKKALPYFRDIYDHAIRVSDTIDNYREAAGSAFDAYMSSVSNNMNEVMKVLSIIATIALPLTVVSGIYGTNFTVLPGSRSVYGFWVMILVMFIISGGMLMFFRKRGWF